MDSKKFRARFVLGVFAFIFGTAAIGWIVGDSILLALFCILGWLVFVGLFLGYAEKQRAKRMVTVVQVESVFRVGLLRKQNL